ncbi:MAG: tetratricopeptide repeat protein, partial [Verrucomicrobiota bacterium]
MMTSDKSKRIEAVCKKANLYGAINRFDAAEKNLMAALDEFDRDNKLLNLLGTMCHRQSRFEEALDFFAEASKKGNHHGLEATINLAITLCDLGRYDDARNAFTVLGQKAHFLPVAGPASNALAATHLKLAKTYISQQLRTEAIAEIKKALKLD